jgi:tetratricopeptide (TPR) repeat protein
LGNSLINVGRVAQARTEFEKALEIDPLNSDAQKRTMVCDLFLSVQNIDSSNSDPAVIDEKLSALIKDDSNAENPDDSRLSQLYAFRGVLFYYRPEKAVESYQKAIRLNAENAVAYSGLSTNYYERGEFDRAEEEARKAWKVAERDPSLKANYADALLANGRYEEAAWQYYDVTQWDPNYIWPYHNAAATSRLIGDLNSSQWYYEQLIVMLEDKQITSLDRNQFGYSFTVGSAGEDWQVVYLYEPPEQRYYAFYGLALTFHLMGRAEDAESYVNKANGLQIDPIMEAEVKRLIQYDINKLQEEQQLFSDRADDFRGEFL